MRYWAPYNGGNGIFSDDPYQDGDPSIGAEGSIPTFRGFEQTLRELKNFVVASGLTPDDEMDGVQVAQAVQNGKVMYGVDAGTANALAVTLDPTPAGYTAGLKVLVLKGASANTAAVSLNVNGLGTKDCVRPNGAVLLAGDLVGSALAMFAYDGTNFQLIAGGTSAASGDSFFDLVVAVKQSTQAWVVPANVHHVLVEAWGGGGGGGAGDGSTRGGGGGGGGEYGLMYLTVTPGETISLIVGAGGPSAFSPGNYGAAGGTTAIWRGLTLLMSCVGGGGGPPGGFNLTGSLPGQGGTGGNYHVNGSGGFVPDEPFHTGSPGGGVALGRLYAMQGNGGLPPGGGGCGNQSDNANGVLVGGATGWVKLTYLRGS